MHKFNITQKIKDLNFKDIEKRLFHYSYDSKNLKALLKDNISTDSSAYISAYGSFKGEVYENIVYELLVDYAFKNNDIKRFIIKGPYQDKESKYIKSGLLIDRSSQIVYKSSYKDISEFDALFFTDDSVYFVEMSTSKKTSSLNKRLDKKYALLKLIFPSLNIKALIVLTKGSVGIKNFPSYATVWVTNDIEDDRLIKNIIFSKKSNKSLKTLKAPSHRKFVEAFTIKYKKFQYFPTLQWILDRSRSNPKFIVDLKFFSSYKLKLFFDIYTKLYIGYLSIEDFNTLFPNINYQIKNEQNQKVLVTIEKVNQTQLDLVYYVKLSNKVLKRVRYFNDQVSIKDKEPDGFTSAEVRFFLKVLENKHQLFINNINFIKEKLYLIK
ncbi:MAG: hypothetical protein ACQERD_07780 [Campylobacterota bacterium]